MAWWKWGTVSSLWRCSEMKAGTDDIEGNALMLGRRGLCGCKLWARGDLGPGW